jgi:hypothetical protein
MHATTSTSALSFRTNAAARLPTRSRAPRTTIAARRLRVQVRDTANRALEVAPEHGCVGDGGGFDPSAIRPTHT